MAKCGSIPMSPVGLGIQAGDGHAQGQGLVVTEPEALSDYGCPDVRTGARLIETCFTTDGSPE